ncbi:MAG: MarC family protein [Actinomycetota bacterium]|nr:MarC family protein [Actinomycetota bacterium]
MAWRTFGESLVTLVVILDPLGTVPVFLSVTQPLDQRARNRAAYVAVLVAAIVLGAFVAFGQALLQYLSISVESLMVAGGVLLFIVALEMLRGAESMSATHEGASVALVPIGTPLLAGPGAIVATIVLIRQHPGLIQRVAVVGGLVVALILVLATLRFASAFSRFLRPSAIHFVTRIMGLLLTAIAVQLVVDAVGRWQRFGLG